MYSCVYNSVRIKMTLFESTILYKGGFTALTDDKNLLINLKKRRRESLEKAIDIYTPYVSVIVYNIIGAVMSKEDIEEVVADVFVVLWKNSEKLDNKKGSLRTYLAAVARSRAINKLRTLQMYEALDENITISSPESDTDLERQEEREMLISLIKDLGEPDSEIFFRFYYYDEKISAISSVMGLCSSTVKTKLARGRQKLKDMLIKRRYGNE